MQDLDHWRSHVKRELKRAGLQVFELPSGQKRIEGDHFAMTISDLSRISFAQLQTICGG